MSDNGATDGPRIALVLGGGGIAGYSFHTAALGALKEMTGWDPRTATRVVGTSAGSSIGALITGGVSVEEMLGRILTVPTDPAGMSKLRSISGRELAVQMRVGLTGPFMALREMTRFPRTDPMRVLTGFLPRGVVDTDVVGEDAGSLHPSRWPSQPLWITAVDADSGDRVVFGRDRLDVPVHRAVEASCSVPGLFRPVSIGRETFIDGGVHSATNADLAIDRYGGEHPDLVVILSPMSQPRWGMKPSLNSVLRIVPSIELRYEVADLRQAGVPVLVVEPNAEVIKAVGPNPMDPTKLVQVVVEASTSTYELLSRSDLQPQLDTLRQAAAVLKPPPDVPFPDLLTST